MIPLFLILALALAAPLFAVAAEPSAVLSAECAVLTDATTGRILFGKNADKRHPMASTTKIMTALVALERCPLDTVVTIRLEAVGVEGSSVYLKAGDRYTMEALLHALLLQSANDAAEAIAYAVAGGVEPFVALMNEEAAALGLTDTHFDNPHGLDGDTHYTTAAELAAITRKALEHPDLARIVSTRRYVFATVEGESARTLINHNKLLHLYEGAVGVKTGFTKRCGRCLVSAATRDGLTLIAVTLDAPSDWHDHAALLDYGYATLESRVLAEPHSLSLSVPVFGRDTTVTVTNSEEIRLTLERTAPSPLPVYELFPAPPLPVTKGALAGYVTYTATDGSSVTSPLVYQNSAS
ncbi:MAG: D-alanyl-D-alanine carboxypeptidase [Clostridia bacterium]|nr:D-alanyl-D-alanine carboxypeptidase [Clostridia bacterium]